MSNKIPRLQNFALLAQLKSFRDTNCKRPLPPASKCAYATSRIYTGESNPLNNEDPRVIIIGAGLAGLSAADYLISKGLENVLVLEASNRYGGRIHSIKLGHSFCELGASWINMTKSPYCMYELAKKCGLIERKEVFKKTDNEVFITSSGDPVQDDMVQLATLLFTNIIDRSENFLELKQAEDEKSLDLRKYFDSEISSILEKLIAKEQITIRKVFNGLLRDLSNTFGSDLGYVSVKQLGIRTKIFSSPVYLCTGLQKIFNQLVKRIPLNQLLLEKPIGNIRWGNLDVGEKPYVKCLDGTKYVADHIICTLPLGVLKTFSEIMFSPELPLTKSNAIRNLGFGSPGKIFLEYDAPVALWFVENIKLAWSLEELINRSNWITGISEITLVPNNPNVLQVKIGGLVAESIERYREEHIGRDVTNMLKKFMKKEDIPNPSRILRTSWSTDPKTLGGIAYLSITSNEVHVNQLAEPLSSKKTSKHPILQFAGDATTWHGFGSMEGARRSGVREAKRIIDFHS